MRLHISCFQRRSPDELARLRSLVKVQLRIESEIKDSSDMSRSDSVVCLLHAESGDTSLTPSEQHGLEKKIRDVISDWSHPSDVTIVLRTVDWQPAAQRQALCA